MKRKGLLAGLGVIGACALCCALPLLGGLAALGITSYFLNPFVLSALALIMVIAGVVFYQRRKSSGSSCMTTGCGCQSCRSEGV
ncbi:hypothetical protein [Cohnella panacarvi]|uniref:hypothetical protein n=1 Tax=Cohnella panacarvi TaxID=400776 RepID=UPI0004AEAA6B|nr:hypothetical protein [Cohnella panacarvi]